MKFGSQQNRVLLGSILALHTVLLALNALWMSPTLDEPAHLVAGISHWRFCDFSLYRVNPPLVRLVASVPAMLFGYSMDFPETLNDQLSRNEFRLGEKFVTENGRWSLWLVTFGRWLCIPFSLLAAWTCYLWGRDLYGVRAGVMAMLLWCFSPMVLGHASLMTPDAPAAALGALACYTFWRWLKKPSWRSTITAGIILGLAELSKTTLILCKRTKLSNWIFLGAGLRYGTVNGTGVRWQTCYGRAFRLLVRNLASSALSRRSSVR